MRLPNKAISYDESILVKLPSILDEISQWDGISPSLLYKKKRNEFIDIAEYLEALDCCFILGVIILKEDGDLVYVN